jgi:anti-sigma regulatory factor (Ser/Thr protein kinase)
MVRQLIDLESFVTLCYARMDMKRRVVDLVDCGHTGMMVVRDRTGEWEMVHGSSLPLGIREGEIFDQITVPFDVGDLFLFYSDGLTDTRNADGELFGLDRLAECVRINRALAPDAIVGAVRAAVDAFAGGVRPHDDLTCVVVKAYEVMHPLAHAELDIRSDLTELGRVRTFVRDFCRGLSGTPLDDEATAQLELAVNEAASNIMKHAYHGRADQRIELDATALPDRVSIDLHHLGDSFDPALVLPPAFDGSRESGFGLYLIARSVDDVRYSRDERGRNCVTLVKVSGRNEKGRTPCSSESRRSGT